jgi:hypothetical protein
MNPYIVSLINGSSCVPGVIKLRPLDAHTATALRTATGRQPGLYHKFVNIIFWRKDPVLVLASKTLRNWAVGEQTNENQIWLEKYLMKMFQDHFTPPVDCPQITWDCLDFNYYGDGSFEPNSIQGVIAESAGETQIKWTFKIGTDDSNQILTIDYDGDDQFDTSHNYEPLS